MAYMYYKTTNENVFFFSYGIKLTNGTGLLIYAVPPKNVPPLVCYNFDTCERILIFFGRNITNN